MIRAQSAHGAIANGISTERSAQQYTPKGSAATTSPMKSRRRRARCYEETAGVYTDRLERSKISNGCRIFMPAADAPLRAELFGNADAL